MAKSWKTLLPKSESVSIESSSVREFADVNLKEIIAKDEHLQQLFSERAALQQKLSDAVQPSSGSQTESRYLSWVPTLADKKKAEKERLKKNKTKEEQKKKTTSDFVKREKQKKEYSFEGFQSRLKPKQKSDSLVTETTRPTNLDRIKEKTVHKEKPEPKTKTNKPDDVDFQKKRETLKQRLARKDTGLRNLITQKNEFNRSKKLIVDELGSKKKAFDRLVDRAQKWKDNTFSVLDKPRQLSSSKEIDCIRSVSKKQYNRDRMLSVRKLSERIDQKKDGLKKPVDNTDQRIKRVMDKKDEFVERISKAKSTLSKKLEDKFNRGFDSVDLYDSNGREEEIDSRTSKPDTLSTKEEEQKLAEKRAFERQAKLEERRAQRKREQKEEQRKEQLKGRKKDRFS